MVSLYFLCQNEQISSNSSRFVEEVPDIVPKVFPSTGVEEIRKSVLQFLPRRLKTSLFCKTKISEIHKNERSSIFSDHSARLSSQADLTMASDGKEFLRFLPFSGPIYKIPLV